MNKTLPVILSLLVLTIGIPSAFAMNLGSPIEASFGLGQASFEIGSHSDSDYVTGVATSSEGMGMAWMGNANPEEKYLGFAFFDKDTPETPANIVVFNTTSTSQFIDNIFLFAEGTTWDLVIGFEDSNDYQSIGSFRSTDNGASWGSLNLAFNGTLAQAGGVNADPMWADVNGDVISVVYRFSENSAPFNTPIKQITSTDGGSTWASDITHSLDSAFDVEFMATHIDTDNDNIIHTIYSKSSEFEYMRSTDSGATFSSPIVISSGEGEADYDNVIPQIFSDGVDVTVLFQEFSVESGIGQVRSNDNGATWEDQEVPFDGSVDCDWSVYDGDASTLTQDGKTLGAMCTDFDNNVDILFSISSDMGENWSALASALTHPSSDPLDNYGSEGSIKIDGSSIYIYSEVVNSNAGESENQHTFVYSEDDGATWHPEERFDNIGEDNGTILTLLSNLWLAFDMVFGSSEVGIYYGSFLPPDSVDPVISTTVSEPITIIQDTEFNLLEFVICIDDQDGDITETMNPEIEIDTSQRGLQTQFYGCVDMASNESQLTVDYIVKKKSTGGSSGGSSGGTTSSSPSLSDIPTLSITDTPREQLGEGQSISSLFANLFDNRITEGITTPAPSQGSSPLGASGETSQRPNPITEFLQNLFANFFN